MRVGRLRHRIEIQKNSPTRDSYGEKSDNWQTESGGTRWAAVEPLSGRELERAQQLNAEATVQVSMRYYDGLTTEHRILHKTRTLEILSIVNRDDRNIELLLLCKEAV